MTTGKTQEQFAVRNEQADRPMIRVETVDLTARGLTLPSDRVGMVIAQPCLGLTAAEPFQCRPELRTRQLAVVNRTLDIARAATHGAQRTHFTIFPECCIPGLAGIAIIDATLQAADWPARSIVIGGVDGLERSDYLRLIGTPNTFANVATNGADCVAADQWINCAVIWVKGVNNVVERWIQPKIYPSRPENNAQYQRMFRGGCVYLFKGLYETGGAAYRFSSLICFDWIATVGALKPWQWLLSSMHNEGALLMASVPLTWMFVIQHNDQPNHAAFLGELADFYKPNQYPSAGRQGTCIVFANNAGREKPGRIDTYGCTSLVLPQTAMFTATDCYVTHSNGGPRFRGNNLVHPHRDVFFREGGSCIHSFIQVNPASIVPGAAGQTVPVENPFVYPVDPVATDPRTPGAAVPGAVKWLNDTLDGIECLSIPFHCPLAPDVAASHLLNVQDLRTKAAIPASKALELSDPAFYKEIPGSSARSVPKHADEWSASETEAFTHVVHTLDIFRVGFPDTTSNTAAAHAETTIRGQPAEILAVRGATHEQNLKHVDKYVPSQRRQLVIVSRDAHNSLLSGRDGTIFRTKPAGNPARVKFNDPGYNRIHLGFQELLTDFITAKNTAELEGGVCARLAN
jgi:hypothetical protein